MLEVNRLSTWLKSKENWIRAVDDISFNLKAKETLAIIGESGCGKSITGLSLMRLLPSIAAHLKESEIKINDTSILDIPENKMGSVRGQSIAMIFQDPMTSLNPVLTIGEQIYEVLRLHQKSTKNSLQNQAIKLLEMVRMPDPIKILQNYPFELSGGMRQRVMIAIAMALKPKLLIADEPTTALDVTTQAQIISLLKDLQDEVGTAIILITHDLGLAYQVADKVALMYAGHFVEYATKQEFFSKPSHPYAIQLLKSIPTLDRNDSELLAIKGSVPKLDKEFGLCKFLDRCEFAKDICRQKIPEYKDIGGNHFNRCHFDDLSNGRDADPYKSQSDKIIPLKSEAKQAKIKPDTQKIITIDDSNYDFNYQKAKHSGVKASDILNISNLKVSFPVVKSIFPWKRTYLDAVDNVSLKIKLGETLALVGESGCGKSTLAKAVLSLISNVTGNIVVLSKNISKLKPRELKSLRQDVQIVFQDPYASLDPRMSIFDIVLEGYKLHNPKADSDSLNKAAIKAIEEVGLAKDCLDKYPHEFSGGQRQRISIARSLILEPKIIVLDEPTSALDLSIQAQILNLLKRLQQNYELTYLFITHNISVVEYMAHNVAVMYLGRIVEYGAVDDIIKDPKHPYTQALMQAVPKIGESLVDVSSKLIKGEAPSAINPPNGCYFNPRCKYVKDICKKVYPPVTYFGLKTNVSCYLYGEK